MARLKHYVKIVLGVSFLFVVCFVGLKGCIVTVWTSPGSPKQYQIAGDGRTLTWYSLPDNRVILRHENRRNDTDEVVLTKMRGTYGTHYVGPIWNVAQRELGEWWILGLRWYPDSEPVVMDIEVKKQNNQGASQEAFPDVGESNIKTILFGDDEVRLEGMWLKHVPLEHNELKNVKDRLGLPDE